MQAYIFNTLRPSKKPLV